MRQCLPIDVSRRTRSRSSKVKAFACSGAMVRMKVDDHSREAFSVEQVLIASASGLKESDKDHLYFFQKVVKTEI